jgi:hypothetical protein
VLRYIWRALGSIFDVRCQRRVQNRKANGSRERALGGAPAIPLGA